jgi:DNA-binding response OmpR family regulator
MRILLIDEDDVSVFLHERMLAPEFQVFGHRSLDAAKNWSLDNEFDVLMVDYSLYDETFPIHVIRELQSVAGKKFRAVICASYIDRNREILLVSAGYQKVFLKPLSKSQMIDYLKIPDKSECHEC